MALWLPPLFSQRFPPFGLIQEARRAPTPSDRHWFGMTAGNQVCCAVSTTLSRCRLLYVRHQYPMDKTTAPAVQVGTHLYPTISQRPGILANSWGYCMRGQLNKLTRDDDDRRQRRHDAVCSLVSDGRRSALLVPPVAARNRAVIFAVFT